MGKRVHNRLNGMPPGLALNEVNHEIGRARHELSGVRDRLAEIANRGMVLEALDDLEAGKVALVSLRSERITHLHRLGQNRNGQPLEK
jgi:hypothetical protein